MSDHTPTRAALLRLIPVDVAFFLLVPPLFGFTLGLEDPFGVTVLGYVLSILRTLAWLVRLRGDMTLAERYYATAPRKRTDALVRDAALAIRRAFTRFRQAYVLGWIAQMVVCVAWVVFTDGVVDGPARSFLVPGGLVCFTITFAAGAHAQVQAAVLLGQVGGPIFGDAEARGIELELPTSSVSRRAALLAMVMVAAPLGWLGAIGYRAVEIGDAREAMALARIDARDRFGADASERAVPSDVRAWAESARTREGTRVDGERGLVFAFVRDGAEVRIGAAPLRSGAASTFAWLLLGFHVVAFVWAPITAAGFGTEIGESVGRISKHVGRLLDIGDLSAMPPLARTQDDEIGELTRHMNELVMALRALAQRSTAVARGELSGTIDGKGELPDAFRGMLEGLRSVVGRVQSTAVELASAAAEIYSASQEQEAAATQQSAGMIEVTRTMDSLSDSAAHIAGAVGNVLEDAERTRSTTEQMALRIAELNAHAGRIAELLEVIREVADRSDLLALNGSLEATRAGDAGRGFSLVAAEMRRLAERVMATVTSVRTLVADVRASGSATVMATDQSRKLAENTSEAARRITLVTQQQRTATDQVTASVREVADVLAQAAVATTQTRVSAESLKAQAEALEVLLAKFSMDAVGAAA